MSKSIEMNIKFEEFHKICRFCFNTDIVLYFLFDENNGKTSKSSAISAFKHLANNLHTTFGLEVCVCSMHVMFMIFGYVMLGM